MATAKEIKDYYNTDNYKSAVEALNLIDVNNSKNKSIPTYTIEQLRTYLNAIGNNQKNLRNMSWWLYYRVSIYSRIIQFYANMFDLNSRAVIPDYNLTKKNDSTKILKNYYKTLVELNRVDWNYEFYNAYVTAFIQDVFYGCVWWDNTDFFLLPLPADYCKIAGKYGDGSFMFAFDYSFFQQNQNLLELWGEPFKSEYQKYLSDTVNGRWRIFPIEHSVCLKFRANEYDLCIPPFTPLFNDLLQLINTQDLEAVREEQEIYKLILFKLETFGKTVDDWKVDPRLVASYLDRLRDDSLPAYTSSGISPVPFDVVDFNNNDTSSDINRTNKAYKNVLDASGGGEILMTTNISGSTAYNLVKILNTEFAISSLLPQTQAIINRLLSFRLTKPSKVKFFEISVYTRDDFRKELMNSTEYGFPNVLAYGSTMGLSELDTLALNNLEHNILNIAENFTPLQSSHTQSGSNDNTKDDSEISDEGVKTRERTDT